MSNYLPIFLLFVQIHSSFGQQQPKIWAVLVAGSNDYYNYRHQADICHAYQILHKHGVPDENIIVMMYDDIANSTQNPTPGIIINHPNGSDVYAGVPKDYTGSDVSPKNFLSVLTGDAAAVQGVGSGKVLKSGPNDHVFLNFADHGAPGILAFPEEELTVKDLQAALKTMYKHKMYSKLVFYVEACESGSMFKNVLPKTMNIFATTAANAEESSYACYYDDKRGTYLGDWYSVNWMEDTDKEDIRKETLQQQFNIVKNETNTSHVMEFGDLSISKMSVAEFQGKKETEKIFYPKVNRATAPTYEVPLDILYRRLSATNDMSDRKKIKTQINDMLSKRELVETTYSRIVRNLALSDFQAQQWFSRRPREISNLNCHDQLVKAFSKFCFNFGKNPYALKFAYILENMCQDNVEIVDAIDTFQDLCSEVTIKTGIH